MTEIFDIYLSAHARLDCIPLRHGRVPKAPHGKFSGFFDDQGTNNQKPKEISAGHKHFVGTLVDSEKNEYVDVRLVLAAPEKYRKARTVISVLIKDVGLATRGVTDLIRALRKEGKITPEQIAGVLHPLYASGKISTETDLFEELISLGVQQKTDDFRRYIEEAEERAENAEKNNEKIQNELQRLRERLQHSEAQTPSYAGEEIEVAPICTLKSVNVGTRTNRRGQHIRCTYFEFEEDVPTRIMDAWADPDGSKTERAKSLINKQVMTTTWKPEVFAPLKWCRNIYEAW